MDTLRVLGIFAHPDDGEIGAAGTLYKCAQKGHRVGILNLTRGEMGTRGTPQIRKAEAQKAAQYIGLYFLEILDLGDATFRNTPENIASIIYFLRQLRPDIVITNALRDRHPDHARAAQLVKDACFYAGLPKWKVKGNAPAYRPQFIMHLIQDYYLEPDFVVDVTSVIEERWKIVKAYASQFYNTKDFSEPRTPIANPDFFPFLEARLREMGRRIGVRFGEGFQFSAPISTKTCELLRELFD